MGRTVPSFRMALEDEINSWNEYRKALDPKTQKLFDEVLQSSRLFCSAASAATRMFKFEGLCMAILLNHFQELQKLCSILEERTLVHSHSRDVTNDD